jgi:lipoprotein-anchoring transpeptidase ErfK/SrfK
VRRAGVLGTLGLATVAAAGLAVTHAPAADDQLTFDAPALTEQATTPAPGSTVAPDAAAAGSGACRLGAPGTACGVAPRQVPQPVDDPLPGCPAGEARAAVVDKAAQRFWLCAHGRPSTERLRMTSASAEYGLPPVGTFEVFAKDSVAWGIHGERLNRFVAFYTTARGNRIAFHEYVNQTEESIGELDMRGGSSGCLRVSTDDSWLVWDFLQIGDPVVVITN